MNYKSTGSVHAIGQEQQITPKFKKRDLTIKTNDTYPQYVTYSALQDNVDMMDTLRVGDEVEIDWVLKGKEAKNGKVYNSLDIIRLAFIASETTAEPEQSFSDMTEIGDVGKVPEFINDPSDLPF